MGLGLGQALGLLPVCIFLSHRTEVVCHQMLYIEDVVSDVFGSMFQIRSRKVGVVRVLMDECLTEHMHV